MKDEYIRKEEVSEWLKQYGQDVIHGKYKFSLMYIWKKLMDLPPADVVPVVHGRWIWKPTKQYCPPDCWYPPLSCNEETWDEKNGTWLEDEMYCSECDDHNYHEIKYNFCPNCGAKMDVR